MLDPTPHIRVNPLSLSQPSLPSDTPALDRQETNLVSLDSSTCTALYSDRGKKVQGGQASSDAASCDSLLWDTGHAQHRVCDSVELDTGHAQKRVMIRNMIL